MPQTATVSRFGRRLLAGGTWVAGGRLAGALVGMLAYLVVARLLPVEHFGWFVYAVALITFGGIVSRCGFDQWVLTQSPSRDEDGELIVRHDYLAEIVKPSLAANLITSALAVLLFATTPMLPVPLRSLPLAVAMAVGISLAGILQLMSEALRSLHQLRGATLFDGQRTGPLVNLVFVAFVVALSRYRSLDLASVIAAYVASYAVVVPMAGCVLWRHWRRHFGSVAVPSATHPPFAILKACIPLLIIQLLAYFSTQLDLWMGRWLLSDESLSYYALARQIAQACLLPLTMINLTVVASVAGLYREGRIDQLEGLLQKAASVALLVSVPVCLTLCLAPGPILSLVDPKYAPAATILSLLMFGPILITLSGAGNNALMMTGHARDVLQVNLVATLLQMLISWIAAHTFGVIGLAVAMSIIVSARNLSYCAMARQRLGIWTFPSLLSPPRILGRSTP